MTRRLAAVLALTLGAACGSESLEPPPPTADAFTRGGFADTLIATSTGAGAAPTTCTNTLPECEAGALSTGSCPANAALGPMDGTSYTVPPGGILEVAFRCGQILEHPSTDGTATYDFTVHAVLPANAEVQIELSYDGSVFTSGYGMASQPDNPDKAEWPIDLSRTAEFTEFVRFVRLVDHQNTGFTVDAVQAL